MKQEELKKQLAQNLKKYVSDESITDIGILDSEVVNYIKNGAQTGYHEGYQAYEITREQAQKIIDEHG